MSDIASKLAAPFDPAIVSWRVGPTTADKSKGMALAYIDARDVMRRLDEVCGPEGWQDEYPWSDGKRVVCRIGVKILTSDPANPDRQYEWIWKTDGAGDTDTEGEKGALSDAFKRAAVKWGVGRYLYDVDTPWVQIEQRGKSYVIPDGERGKLAGILRQQIAPPAANGKVSPATAEREAQLAKATAFKDEIKAAIEAAAEPTAIDRLLKVNAPKLQFVKLHHAATYDRLMELATARSNELRASA